MTVGIEMYDENGNPFFSTKLGGYSVLATAGLPSAKTNRTHPVYKPIIKHPGYTNVYTFVNLPNEFLIEDAGGYYRPYGPLHKTYVDNPKFIQDVNYIGKPYFIDDGSPSSQNILAAIQHSSLDVEIVHLYADINNG